MGTQTYDMLVLVAVILLMAIVIYWSVRYGAGMVGDVMNEAPSVLQSSFASYASLACMAEGNMLVEQELSKQYPMYVFMNATHVKIYTTEGAYTGETERGGSVTFGERTAVPFISCGTEVVRKNVFFNQNVHHFISLTKTGNSMQIGVR